MPVDIRWENEAQTVICVSYSRPWTWTEYHHALDTMDKWMRRSDKRVHLIIDVRDAGLPPSGAMPHFRRAAQMQHVNRGQFLVVGNSALIRTFVNMSKQVYGRLFTTPDFTFVTSMEEANEKLDDMSNS
jgi:hypothetical protein